MTAAPTIGVDLGGTNVRAAVVDRDGTVLDERRAATPASWPELVDAIVNAANDVHGYAHVRRSSITAVRAIVTRQLSELTGSGSSQLDRSAAAR